MADKERSYGQSRDQTPVDEETKSILEDLKNKLNPKVIDSKTWPRP